MLSIEASGIMTKKVKTVSEDTTIREAAELMVRNKISGLPVLDSRGVLVGMVSEADLLNDEKRLAAIPRMALYGLHVIPQELLEKSYNEGFSLKVKDVMTHKVITASPDTPVEEIADTMLKKRINRVPILKDGKLVGIVTRNDILRAISGS